MKKLLSIVLALLMIVGCFAFAACGKKEDDKSTDTSANAGDTNAGDDTAAADDKFADLKIGFIFLHDEKSTYDLNFLNAAKAAQAALGLSDEQVILKTNIPESNDCYEAAADLADMGCDIVFANSFGHEAFMIQAAMEFPEVQFCHATGTMAHTEGLDNFHNAFANIYEGRYLAGVAAGLKLNAMIEAGEFTAEEAKIGYVGAFTYAEVISGYTSFYLGAKSVCPSVTMDVQFTGSWYDAPAEREAALALINGGCKLISQHADSMGAPSACEENGIPNVSYNGSTVETCPNTFIISSAINWQPYFEYIANCVADGEAIAADWCAGIEEGSVVLAEINDTVAAEGTAAKLDEVKAALADGTLHVFDTATFTVGGETLTSYMADVDTDAAYEKDTEVIADGYFHESEYRSAPYFDIQIDGITLLNTEF